MDLIDENDCVHPDGLTVRRMRHENGWSPRELIDAIGDASERATGLRETVTPNLLIGIEEHDEMIPYATLCLLADGLDCDPAEIRRNGPREPEYELLN